jgi:hypothetical protein
MSLTSQDAYAASQSRLMLVIGVGYVAMAFYAIIRWNDAVSMALITGFSLLAQRAITDYFTFMHNSQTLRQNGVVNATITSS